MEVRPDHSHCYDPSLARTGGHSEGVSSQVLNRQVLHTKGVEFRHITPDLSTPIHRRLKFDGLGKKISPKHLGGSIDQVFGVAIFENLDYIGKRLHRLALAEVVAEWNRKPCDFMVFFKPISKQVLRYLRGTIVFFLLSPGVDFLSQFVYQKQTALAPAGFVHAPAVSILYQKGIRLLPGAAPENFR